MRAGRGDRQMIGIHRRFAPDDGKTDVPIRNILIASVVITIFVDIILFYYNVICSEKRNNIIRDGQVTAMQTADHLNDYLSTGIDTLKLTAYTLEEM